MNRIIRFIKNKKEVLVLAVLVLIIINKAIFPFGIRVANDFPIVSTDTLNLGFASPQIWANKTADGLGEYSVITLWSWPLEFLGGVASKVGLDFGAIVFFVLLAPTFILGIISIRKILDSYGIKNPGKFVGTLVYIANTYLLLLVDGGQLSIALTYSVFPIIFILFKESINGSLKKKLLAALGFCLLGFLDIRYLFVLGIFVLIYFLYLLVFLEKRIKTILEFFKTGFISVLIFFLLNIYWILPFFLVKTNFIPLAYDTNLKSFTNLFHSLTLLHPNWYQNIFGKISDLRFEFIFIPILAFLAPVLRRRDKMVVFWLLIALVGIFLTKSSSPPLSGIYTWLYINLPGFNLFRDSTKFFLLTALSYSILIGISVNQISKLIKPFYILVVVYLLLIISPVYLGKMSGFFSQPLFAENYAKVSANLGSDNEFGRIMWLPSRTPLGFINPTHPSIESLRIANVRPFAISRVGTYDTLNFLRSDFIQEILKIAGVKYLVYPYPDVRRNDLKEDNIKYYFDLLGFISSSSWAKTVTNFGTREDPISLIEVKEHLDRFFIPHNTWIVVGSDRIYTDLVKGSISLANNALVFAEEKVGLGSYIDSIPFSKIVLYNKTEVDLMALLLGQKQYIFPASNLNLDPDKSGWWKRDLSDVSSLRTFLEEKYTIDNQDFDYGGGLAIAEGHKELMIDDKRLIGGQFLYARVLKSNKGGKIIFSQGGRVVGSANTKTLGSRKMAVQKYDEGNFVWVKIGSLVEGNDLKVEADGDLNIVNALISARTEEIESIQDKIQDLKNKKRVVVYQKDNISQLTAKSKISYEVVSTTHYKVRVEGLESPMTLAFSENYNSLWKLGDNSSYPLYSLINGFNIFKNGEYDLVFTPQKYVDYGFKFSLAAFFVLIFVILLI